MKNKIPLENSQVQLVGSVILSFFLLFGLISCNRKNTIGSSDFPSDIGGTNGTGNSPPPKNFLWLHHKSVTGAPRYTHKDVTTGTWPDLCQVDLDAVNPADRDIMCTTETTELDLMHLGMNLQYNVPAHTKCPYVLTMAPYFYQYESPRTDGTPTPPIEPAVVVITDDRVSPPGNWSAQAFYANGTTPNNYFEANNGKIRCGFDYTAQTPAGPNCCEGDYNLTTILIEPDDGGGSKTTYLNSRASWGGKRGSCLAGPAMELHPLYESGFPAPIIWRMKEHVEIASPLIATSTNSISPLDLFGILTPNLTLASETKSEVKPNFGNFEIASLLVKKLLSSRYLANYTQGATPRPYQDILDYNFPPGNNFYTNYMDPRYFTVLCMDTAQEVSARIRLRIREWNTAEALIKATEPTGNEDDIAGNETDYPAFPNQDYLDWEDTSNLYRWNGSASVSGYPAQSL